jgi:hypothetical protein
MEMSSYADSPQTARPKYTHGPANQFDICMSKLTNAQV